MLKLNKYLYFISQSNFCTTTTFKPVCTKDFLIYAQKYIKSDLFSYYQSGATNEYTLAANEQAFSKFLFEPRMLRNVSNIDLHTKILGSVIHHPFGFAPTATHKIAHFDGESATALGAALTGTPMIVSTLSSVPLEEIAKVYLNNYNSSSSKIPLWFQLYIFKDRILTKSLIQRAEDSGYTAIVLTVDTPVSGIRYQNLRSRLAFPRDINYANLSNHLSLNNEPDDNFFAQVANNFDDSLTWESAMEYLRSVTKLPIIVKGILSLADATLAVKHGVNGIVVSNHGARQLDTVPPSLECLARISAGLQSSVELYMDGGVRSGDDILKALALGAKVVFLGRPVLWSLAYGGTEGVVELVEILRRELNVSMALNGLSNIKKIPRNTVVRASEYFF